MVLKYSIDNVINYPSASDFYYDPTYARNENIATRGHDYNFGTVTTNASGDSIVTIAAGNTIAYIPCLLYTSPSPRDGLLSRMPSSA